MKRVVHFEIPVENPEKSIPFFERVFGWKFTKWDGPMPYWIIDTGGEGPGINGGLMRRNDPSQPIVNTIDVPSVDEYIGKIEFAGGQIVVPKMPIPGIGWLAYFKDLDGLIHGIMQEDASAGS